MSHQDNSFSYKHSNKKWIDLIVFAGTPEWISFRKVPIYNYIRKFNIPYFILGVNTPIILDKIKKMKIKKIINFENLIKDAKLITFRNYSNDVLEYFKKLNKDVYYTGCPALFSYNKNMEYTPKEKEITFVFSFPDNIEGHHINEKDFNYTIRLIKYYH